MQKLSCDLLVIGAGSGGVAAALRASKLGASCVVANYVRPSPHGTSWGIGGTCVNVGCIPKKLMHIAATKAGELRSLEHFGFEKTPSPKITWKVLQKNVTNYIRSLNFKTNSAFSQANIQSLNAFATFRNHDDEAGSPHSSSNAAHEICCENADSNEKWIVQAKNVIIATGGRPKIPDIPGAREFGITSDDIFWSKEDPGDVLIIGAGYIALECAGFFGKFAAANGRRKPVMLVRSKVLRDFDADAVQKVVENMEDIVDISYDEPVSVEKASSGNQNAYVVRTKKGKMFPADSVIFATGRRAETRALRLSDAGIEVAQQSGKILVNCNGETSAKGVYALGDIVENSVELTPMAIYEGRAISDSLFSKIKRKDRAGPSAFAYDKYLVPTTIFTPIEYGKIGYTEAHATEKFGKGVVKVYHTAAQTLENAFLMQFANSKEQVCFLKVVTRKASSDSSEPKELVVGWHLVCPNAGEITQGVALAMLRGVSMDDIESLLGIHPTTAECIKSLQDKDLVPVAEIPGC